MTPLATRPAPDAWPRNFGAAARELIRGRDARPPGSPAAFCVVGGEPLGGRRHAIHPRKLKKHGGDGRPSNGIAVCELDPGCGHLKIHREPGWARGLGLLITGAVPGRYDTPLLCAVRGWIVLDDEGGWEPAAHGYDRTWRPPL